MLPEYTVSWKYWAEAATMVGIAYRLFRWAWNNRDAAADTPAMYDVLAPVVPSTFTDGYRVTSVLVQANDVNVVLENSEGRLDKLYQRADFAGHLPPELEAILPMQQQRLLRDRLRAQGLTELTTPHPDQGSAA